MLRTTPLTRLGARPSLYAPRSSADHPRSLWCKVSGPRRMFKAGATAGAFAGAPSSTALLHDWTATVTTCGPICCTAQGEPERALSNFDDETCRRDPIDNPFSARVLPMCGMHSHPCVRNGPEKDHDRVQ